MNIYSYVLSKINKWYLENIYLLWQIQHFIANVCLYILYTISKKKNIIKEGYVNQTIII
jgi:hypothetical protein